LVFFSLLGLFSGTVGRDGAAAVGLIFVADGMKLRVWWSSFLSFLVRGM